MTPHDSPMTADLRVSRAVRFMKQFGEEVDLLGTMMQLGPDYAAHDRLPNYEEAARKYGMHLFYLGAEVSSYFSNEPLYFVFLSTREELTIEDIRKALPGFEPIHYRDEAPVPAAA